MVLSQPPIRQHRVPTPYLCVSADKGDLEVLGNTRVWVDALKVHLATEFTLPTFNSSPVGCHKVDSPFGLVKFFSGINPRLTRLVSHPVSTKAVTRSEK